MIEKVIDAYKANFSENDEFLAIKSPGRINLIGEHTDYNNGYVFPAAIDKYIYTVGAKNKTNIINVVSLKYNQILTFDVTTTQKPSSNGWENYIIGVVEEFKKLGCKLSGFNAVFDGDIPRGAGLSSSAALENSFGVLLENLFDLSLSKKDIALASQQAEHNYAGVNCGLMDQYASIFGEKEKALVLNCDTNEHQLVNVYTHNYEIVLINTNVKHELSSSAYNERREQCETALKAIQKKYPQRRHLSEITLEELTSIEEKVTPVVYQRALYIVNENRRVLQAIEALESDDILQLGSLMFQSHQGLSESYEVSCDELDFLVEKAKQNPFIVGSRMMGGGFGGCTINIIEKGQTNDFVNSVAEEYIQKFGLKISVITVKFVNGTHVTCSK
ncbi:galactokinase [Zhouia sp. PK063]|uniref:galactokinase n=1 Tax=Zhouia sp. PK063 TaxID=3373602 RepID=UPI00379CBA97